MPDYRATVVVSEGTTQAWASLPMALHGRVRSGLPLDGFVRRLPGGAEFTVDLSGVDSTAVRDRVHAAMAAILEERDPQARFEIWIRPLR